MRFNLNKLVVGGVLFQCKKEYVHGHFYQTARLHIEHPVKRNKKLKFIGEISVNINKTEIRKEAANQKWKFSNGRLTLTKPARILGPFLKQPK